MTAHTRSGGASMWIRTLPCRALATAPPFGGHGHGHHRHGPRSSRALDPHGPSILTGPPSSRALDPHGPSCPAGSCRGLARDLPPPLAHDVVVRHVGDLVNQPRPSIPTRIVGDLLVDEPRAECRQQILVGLVTHQPDLG